MGIKARRFSVCFLMILCAAFCTAMTTCVRLTEEEKMYGKDVYYFLGLNALQHNEHSEASHLFKKAIKNARPAVARLALEELCELGSSYEREKYAMQAYETYKDERAVLLASRELFASKRYRQIVEISAHCDVTTCDNELAFYRCVSLNEEKDGAFVPEMTRWFFNRPFSTFHKQAASRLFEQPSASILFRSAVLERNYNTALTLLSEVCENPQNISAQLLSDVGKALLYSSQGEPQEKADFLLQLVPDVSLENRFYIYFYAGRIYDNAQVFPEKALENFLQAMNFSSKDDLYDNALWYYLNAALKDSISRALSELALYCEKWHDAHYFDDFLETLSVRLISKHLWKEYYQTALLLDGKASSDSCAQYNYIAARLIEEHYFVPEDRSAVEAGMQLYSRVLSSSDNLYYLFLAAKKAGLSTEDVKEKLLCLKKDKSFKSNNDASYILQGYVDFGVPEKIYAYWQNHFTEIPVQTSSLIASYLLDCANENHENALYYTQSLRIASRKFYNSEDDTDETLWKLSFPRDFQKSVEKHCQTFGLKDYLLYALIRSESFFDPHAKSSAGAVGLTQFMPATAEEVAHKLKVQDWNLTQSDTSIQFGAYYFSNLISRLDNIPLFAAFAYNAGASKVFSWLRTVNLVFEKDFVPNDLFLESVPIAETREYGRKIVSAAAMYALLYEDKNPSELIDEVIFGISGGEEKK